MARGLYVVDQLPPLDVANRPAVNTFTAAQDIYGAPQKILPKSRMDVGLSLDLEAWGEFSTTGTPTLAIGFGIGASPLSATGLVTLALCNLTATASGAAAFQWHAHWMGTLQAVGTGSTGGTFEGMGTVDLGSSLTAMTGLPMPITAAARSVGFDCTADRALNVIAQWGTSSVSNSIAVHKFFAKVCS